MIGGESAEGKVIGNKWICGLQPQTVSRLRLSIATSLAPPEIRSFSGFMIDEQWYARHAYRGHEWFWEPGDERIIYPLNRLTAMYERSVGHYQSDSQTTDSQIRRLYCTGG
jgi:hypothetical protein